MQCTHLDGERFFALVMALRSPFPFVSSTSAGHISINVTSAPARHMRRGIAVARADADHRDPVVHLRLLVILRCGDPAVVDLPGCSSRLEYREIASGVNNGIGAADHKGLAAFDEIRDNLGKCLRAVGADRMPGIIDKDQIAVGH